MRLEGDDLFSSVELGPQQSADRRAKAHHIGTDQGHQLRQGRRFEVSL
jgi:hypothetical protein